MDSIDQNTMNNIKNMVDNGDLNGAISQISPEMIQNFSKMFANGNNNHANNTNTKQETTDQIDMSQIMKLAETFQHQKDDPRNNLLNSLKPYLRDGKKEKLDSYINLMNMSKIAEIMKNNANNKENS